MTPRERLEAVFDGRQPDRTPILGGWITCPEHICNLTNKTLKEYWNNPTDVSIQAYKNLGTDGLISVFVPISQKDFRCVDNETYVHAQSGMSLESAVEEIDKMPEPEKYETDFDYETAYKEFSDGLKEMQKKCGDMVWMPAQWSASARISWYGKFGYENFFCIVGGYPKQAIKLMDIGGRMGRCGCNLIARAVKEGLYPKAVLLGEDICTQRGPMVSPAFMEKYYAPNLKYAIQPLLEVGCKPVWHSDGNVIPMVDMLIECGIQGFQGFQPECGMTIEYITGKRTKEGKRLLIFGPLAVTSELPFCSPEQIMQKVKHAIEVCKGNADLCIFTSNTINPDVPLENIRVMYEAVLEQ